MSKLKFLKNLFFVSTLLPFSNGAFLYFSSRLTAIDSNRTLAAGYSFNTSHISFLLSTNKSLYPTDLTLAVLRFPVYIFLFCF